MTLEFSKQVRKIIKEMRNKQAMPPIDLRFYPLPKTISRACKTHIQLNAERAATQCETWAQQLSDLLNPEVPETIDACFTDLHRLTEIWLSHKKHNSPCEGIKAAIILICQETLEKNDESKQQKVSKK